jgi:hypothetical protein
MDFEKKTLMSSWNNSNTENFTETFKKKIEHLI